MKAAIIGCGSIGQRHARNLHGLGVRDFLLVDPDFQRATSLAQELGAAAFEIAADAFARRPEVALICAPTNLHLSLAWRALDAGCHLFVEKPISNALTGVRELVETAAAKKHALSVGYNLRFDPIVIQISKWLAAETIGHVVSARLHFGSYLPWRHPWEDYRRGYGARRELGGGVLLDAIHELDLAISFFGQPKAIYCTGGTRSDLEIDTDDTAEILMLYSDKTISIHLDYIERPAARWLEIIGTQGKIGADLFARTARYFDGELRRWMDCPRCGTMDETYQREMAHLLECVEGRAMPLVNGEAALASLALAEDARLSMKTKAPVRSGPLDIGAYVA